MIVEDQEMPNGWPLGLGNLNMRLGVTHNIRPPSSLDPYSLNAQNSSTFSSFSSSNLDTESTASFFRDHSVPLGRLIGIRSRERGDLYFEQQESVSQRRSSSYVDGPKVQEKGEEEMSRGICVPLLVSILVKKMSPSRNNSKR